MHKKSPKSFDYYYLKMDHHYLTIPYYKEKRRVRVLLPKGYRNNTDQHYPVLYMHDGENVFYSKEAYVGYSWKLIPTIKNNLHIPRMIVVAVDNAHENRLNEYGPWVSDLTNQDEFAYEGGDGEAYGEWFVNELKPFIDSTYRTMKEREGTLLAGSSMGGIITAYMGAKYPDVFGHLGVFSLASWFSEKDFLQFVENHKKHPGTKIYIQVGTNEGDAMDDRYKDLGVSQAYIDSNIRYYNALLKNGHPLENMWFRILAGEKHHEFYWAKHFAEFLEFAFEVKK